MSVGRYEQYGNRGGLLAWGNIHASQSDAGLASPQGGRNRQISRGWKPRLRRLAFCRMTGVARGTVEYDQVFPRRRRKPPFDMRTANTTPLAWKSLASLWAMAAGLATWASQSKYTLLAFPQVILLPRHLLLAALLLAVGGCLLAWRWPQVAPRVASVTVCLVLVTACWSRWLSGQVPEISPGEWAVGVPFIIERYGPTGRPGSAAQHRRISDYSVQYTFDRQGWRALPPVPAPPTGAERTLFLGCSFTFGVGVADDQCYPAVLAAQHWRGQKQVEHCSAAGWGTVQAWRVLTDRLAEGPPLGAVYYAWIREHAQRNERRYSWHGHPISRLAYRLPGFELQGDRWHYQGMIRRELANSPDSLALAAREVELSLHLVSSMAQMCQQHRVSFVLVALAMKNEPAEPDLVVARAPSRGVEVLDLRTVSGPYFEVDPHPTAAWHAAIARRIAVRASRANPSEGTP